MNMKTLTDRLLSGNIWNISGSFGRVSGNSLSQKNEFYKITSSCKKNDENVYHITGNFTNVSENDITLNTLKMRFNLGGGEFEVYTQYNGWQNESSGGWSPLITSVSASTNTIRTCDGAAPFAAVWNKQTQRGIVFHLLADYAWSINLSLSRTNGECSELYAEIGVNSESFSYTLSPQKSIKTPEIIFYEFENKLDLDCRKLHSFCLDNFKRKSMPVVYNTWLCRFDKINFENVSNQIEKAAQIGAEYFVIDAGWFGKGSGWWIYRGDWAENLTGGLCGKMYKISEQVRKSGMKFGLWFEIESASEDAEILRTHSDLFVNLGGLYFLDFSNEKACQYIFGILKENIEKYNIEYIKFDFNQDFDRDPTNSAYTDYYAGYRKFTKKFKNEYPGIYLENCASGGLRADLNNCRDFDSFWLSDNQSPYEGMRIFKEGIKRLPPQCIEKWAVLQSLENFSPVYGNNECEKILSTHDATWDGIAGVHQSFLQGFLTGGPIGISCDLNMLSDNLLTMLKEHIGHFKKERTFWENAVCKILADTGNLLVLEYFDRSLKQIKIIAYALKLRQNNIMVYPYLDKSASYKFGEKIVSGSEIAEHGIDLPINGNYRASFAELGKE